MQAPIVPEIRGADTRGYGPRVTTAATKSNPVTPANASTVTDFVDVSEHNTVKSVYKVATDAIIIHTGWGIGGDDKLADEHVLTTRARRLRFGTTTSPT